MNEDAMTKQSPGTTILKYLSVEKIQKNVIPAGPVPDLIR